MAKGPMGGGSFQVPSKPKALTAENDGMKRSVAPKEAPMSKKVTVNKPSKSVKTSDWSGDIPPGGKSPDPTTNLGGSRKLGNHYDNGGKKSF